MGSLGLQKLAIAIIVGFSSVLFSLAYAAARYGYYCSCCSCSTRLEKEEVTTQEHKKLASKRNPRNSKPRKICCFQH